MNIAEKNKNFGIALITQLMLGTLLLFWLAVAAFGQADSAVAAKEDQAVNEQQTIATTAVLQPVISELKSIKIGMSADEVKEKLGKPEAADKNGFYYVFSDAESAQITLDADRKVRMIALIYNGKDANAPKFEEVFGSAVAFEKAADNRVYKLIRYPEAGYWVAYSQIMVQDAPMTTVTMQKMRGASNSSGDKDESSSKVQ